MLLSAPAVIHGSAHRVQGFYITAGDIRGKDHIMTKIIDFKKSIVKKGKKEKATDDEFYAEINQTKDLIPFTFDADTPEIEELSSVIAYTIAVRSAQRFMTISECMDDASIRKILSTIEEMPSREAVKMLQALFIADGMILESEDLDLIDMCAEFCKDVYDYFTDFFLQTDEIEPFLVANWLSEPNACIVLKMPGGEHDKNYCHM